MILPVATDAAPRRMFDVLDGAHDGIAFADYLAIDAVSNSGVLKLMARSPLYCEKMRGEEVESTKAMRAGAVVNDLVLVPDLWPDRFTVVGRCVATKGDGARCSNMGVAFFGGDQKCGVHSKGETPDDDARILVDQETVRRSTDMADAVKADPDAAAILAKCKRREVSLVWHDKATGLRCKGRLDLLDDGYDSQIWDLKKSVLAHPESFPREILKRGYHRQLAWYDDGARALGYFVQTLGLLVVNDCAADDVHEVGTYPVIQDAIEAGREWNRATLARYAECVKSGVFPGFGVVPMSIPAWAMKQDDEEVSAVDGATEVLDG